MLKQIEDFIKDGNNLTILIIIASIIGIIILLLLILLLLGLKKKKYRKQLNLIRIKIENLRQHDVIKNYNAYDNLKNDQKLGMLVLKWKKEIENFIREVDAHYSMLDVLEDAISQGNYQYFITLKVSMEKDVQELEEKANNYQEEIIEYVDMASDNRKYIDKYQEMLIDIKQEYIIKSNIFKDNKEKVEKYFNEIDKKFTLCYRYIESSNFSDADNIASEIFKDIKIMENYIRKAPELIKKINEDLKPKIDQLNKLIEKFADEELQALNIDCNKQVNHYLTELNNILSAINDFTLTDFTTQLQEIEYYIQNTISRLEKESINKDYINDNFQNQKNELLKIEKTAKNFIAIFKIVTGSYNITNKEIEDMEALLSNIELIKGNLQRLENYLALNQLTFNEAIGEIEKISNEIMMISKELDEKLVIIDEIYKDEKAAREQINLMTEKINGTKKYIKYANLDSQDKYLKILKQLNQDLAQLYILLGSFPIDIVKLNQAVKVFVNRVENTTQEINRIIYQILLTEFVLMYANRYFKYKEYQNQLLLAEELFYKKNYNKAYEIVMNVLEEIDARNKKLVLEKYQEKFNEIFS